MRVVTHISCECLAGVVEYLFFHSILLVRTTPTFFVKVGGFHSEDRYMLKETSKPPCRDVSFTGNHKFSGRYRPRGPCRSPVSFVHWVFWSYGLFRLSSPLVHAVFFVHWVFSFSRSFISCGIFVHRVLNAHFLFMLPLSLTAPSTSTNF